jgi:hypothetical protein
MMGQVVRMDKSAGEVRSATMCRPQVRKPLQLPVDVVTDSDVWSGIVTKLSEYGAIVVTQTTAPVGSTVALRLWLSTDAPLALCAIVRGAVVSNGSGEESRGLLVELAGAEPSARERIRHYIAAAGEVVT